MRRLKDKVAIVAGAGHRRQVSPGRVMPDPLRIPSALLGSVLLGAASGLRAQIGLAMLVARQDPSLPPFLQRPWTRRLLVAGAGGELVMDKLPSIPSRLVRTGDRQPTCRRRPGRQPVGRDPASTVAPGRCHRGLERGCRGQVGP